MGLLTWRRLSTDLKVFWSLIGFGAITDIVSIYFGYHEINNLWLLNTYTILEYTLLMITFSFWVSEKWTAIYRMSIPVVIILFIVSNHLFKSGSGFNSIGQIAENILLVIAALIVLYNVIIPTEIPLYRNYKMWIVTGILFYFGFTSFIFLLWRFHLTGFFPELWFYHSLVNILSNVLFGVSFLWVQAKT